MPPSTKPLSQAQPSQKKRQHVSLKAKTVRLDSEESSSSEPSKLRRMDPMTAFSKTTPTPTLPPPSSKGKEKEKEKEPFKSKNSRNDSNDRLWIDKYEPGTEASQCRACYDISANKDKAELAVHVRKVEDVRRWITEAFDGGPSGKLTKYRRILALTGPSGTGKTATIRILAQELGFEILEWRNSIGETASSPFGEVEDNPGFGEDYESLFTKFEAFMTRASACQNLFAGPSQAQAKRRIVLLEDIPNILHQKTQVRFHEALNALVTSPPSNPPVPLIVIVSDAGMRGMAVDERMADGGGFGKDKQVVDVRSVLSKGLLGGPYVTEISFNPIAPTLMRKALQAMINTHFSKSNLGAPSKDVLDIIVESSNGDIRSAIMALQFACIAQASGSKKKNAKIANSLVLEAVTRREQSLALFHLLGKVLYNKRKNDPISSSASAKDILKEKNMDALLKDPAKLPAHLEYHERRATRVDVDALYSDSPIETSLFSLYIQQNYTQFCEDVDQCEGVADWLSWVDCSGGDAWYNANPHQFHLLALGTLHSLPSPVPRRSQKYYKPEFFAFLQQEKDAWDAVRNTRDWMTEAQITNDGRRVCGWTKNDIVLELGGVLKAHQSRTNRDFKAPPSHALFSRMQFMRTGSAVRAQQIDEGDSAHLSQEVVQQGLFDDTETPAPARAETGGWLESDDIEDF